MTFTRQLLIGLILFPLYAACALAREIVVPKREIDTERMVYALAMVENGDPNALGGKMCISEAVWHDRTKMPYSRSREPSACRVVAYAHIAWLSEQLKAHDIRPSALILAQCWRYGLTAYLRSKVTGDYARRTENLFNDGRSIGH